MSIILKNKSLIRKDKFLFLVAWVEITAWLFYISKNQVIMSITKACACGRLINTYFVYFYNNIEIRFTVIYYYWILFEVQHPNMAINRKFG